MDSHSFFARLWSQYLEVTPQAKQIRHLFLDRGMVVANDHVAFRTFDQSPIDLEHLEPLVLDLGYRRFDQYLFPEKRLRARSYLGPEPDSPRLFISELLSDRFSSTVQRIVRGLCEQIDRNSVSGPESLYAGRLWGVPEWGQYRQLAEESEYAAWLSVMGLRANHFTISVNQLGEDVSLQWVNGQVRGAGFSLNTSGGEIKGSPATFLEQSSTLADRVTVRFADGDEHLVSSCYYEFARRYPQPSGELFQGFVTASADRIFESTSRED